MNALFKHFTVRLWLTALVGGAVCLAVLPWWQRLFGLNMMVLPAMAVLVVNFIIIGWALNRLGLNFMDRHVKEASAWERAGMMKEADSALQRCVACFDSYWLSPLLRRRRTTWMMGILARFYLNQTARNHHARTLVADYLSRHSHDDIVAQGWLEQLLNREHHSPKEYEAAACVGKALADHNRIQQLLMQFHLANDRSDFEAIQNYQKVWQQQPLPRELVHGLARLLLNEGVLNHWALTVYLSAYQSGYKAALDGIAAAVRWLRPTVENRQDLDTARPLVDEVEPERIERLARRFQPAEPATPIGGRINKRVKRSAVRARILSKDLADSGRTWALSGSAWAGTLAGKLRTNGLARMTAIGGGIALVAIVLFAMGWQLLSKGKAPPQPPIEQVKPIIEPFTIQVAAYVNAEDARRVVDRLKQQGLDAFWTEATSAERTWYQVKVSHFETKEQARKYGQELKTKGFIDDFYVANYRKPQPRNP